MPFQKGDLVKLNPNSNGSNAYKSLSAGSTYAVEALGSRCSFCGTSYTGASVKVMGVYYCENAFVPAAHSAGVPAPVAGQVAPVAAAKGGISKHRDPARQLYATDVDWFDCLPDATADEAKRLPTLEQLYAMEQERLKR